LSFTLRKVAGTAVLAVAASGLSLPLAPVAHAVGSPVEAEYFIADTDGDFSYELWVRPTAGGSAVPVAGNATHDIDNLSFSQDGSRLVYLQRTLNATTGDVVSTQIVVRDVSDRLVRVVSSVLESAGEVAQPTLSPGGNEVAWTSYSANGPALYRADVGSGAPALVKGGYMDPVFVADGTLLARSAANGSWASVTIYGAVTANSTLTSSAFDLAVSEDGQHLAWAQDTSTSSTSTSDIETATLSVVSGVATIGTPVVVATGLANEAPSFSVNGNTLYFVRWDGDQGAGDVWSGPTVPSGGNPPAVSVSTPGDDDYDVAIGTTDDGTAPAAAGTAVPAVLSGTSATVRWSIPADADLSGVLITRKLGSTTQKFEVYVPAPMGSYVDTGLTLGATYTYEITAIDRSDNRATVATRHLMALQAAATFADPTSGTSAKAAFPVSFGPSSSGRFTVDYLLGGTSTWHRWVTDTAGRTRTFGSVATTGVAATTSTPGASYGFRVQVKDSYGNATALLASAHAVVPFDQTKATLSGGTNVSTTAAFLGSYRRLSKTTDYAKVTLVGSRLQVVGWKCTSCGVFAIYDGSSLVGTVDTRASSTITRTVLFTRTYSSVGTHTFTIRPKATSGRPYVLLDGFAMRR
jgi:hypothetical protein